MLKKIPLKNWFAFFVRKFFPIPTPPNIDDYDNICDVELVPKKELLKFYKHTIGKYFKNKKIIVHFEFGVFNGNSLSVAYKYYENRQKKTNHEYRLVAFDSFQGLPKEAEDEDGGVWEKGMYACDRQKVEDCLIKNNVNLDKVEFVEGWYGDTLRNNKFNMNYVDVVFVDSDTYGSAKLILDFIEPMIKDKVLICFDDWKLKDLDLYELGESKAFEEFLIKNNHVQIEEVTSYNNKSKSFILYIKGGF